MSKRPPPPDDDDSGGKPVADELMAVVVTIPPVNKVIIVEAIAAPETSNAWICGAENSICATCLCTILLGDRHRSINEKLRAYSNNDDKENNDDDNNDNDTMTVMRLQRP